MSKIHEKLLEILKSGDFTLRELAEIIGYSPDGLRGRISEINSKKHRIKRVNKKYHLIIDTKIDAENNVKRILDFAEEYHLYDQRIHIEKLMIGLNLSRGEIDDALSKIYGQRRLLQYAKDVVIIYSI